MRIAQKQVPEREENVIPLINVVFLLLVFFLLTSTLAPPVGLKIDPVISAQGETPKNLSGLLAIDAAGLLAFEGKPLSRAALAGVLSAHVENAPKARASTARASTARAPLARLRILADRALDASVLLEIAAIAQTAGVRRIELITERGGK